MKGKRYTLFVLLFLLEQGERKKIFDRDLSLLFCLEWWEGGGTGVPGKQGASVKHGGGALLPNVSPDGLPPITDLVVTWPWDDSYDPPITMAAGIHILLSLKEHNLNMLWGACYCPAPEKFYPIRYYVAYSRYEIDGLLRIKEMQLAGLCRYRSEGPGMSVA